MKKIISIFLSLFTIINFIQAQKITNYDSTGIPAAPSYQYYIQKADKQLKTGKVFLIGGSVLTATGLVIMASSLNGLFSYSRNQEAVKSLDAGAALSYIGAGFITVSIPIFISGLHNKKKARFYSSKSFQ